MRPIYKYTKSPFGLHSIVEKKIYQNINVCNQFKKEQHTEIIIKKRMRVLKPRGTLRRHFTYKKSS